MEECLNKNLPIGLKEKYKTEEFYNSIIVDNRIPKDVIEIIKKEYERDLPFDVLDPIMEMSYVDRFRIYSARFSDPSEAPKPCIYWKEGKDEITGKYVIKIEEVDDGFIPIKDTIKRLKEYSENSNTDSYNKEYEWLLLNLQDKKHYLHLSAVHFAYLNYITLKFILELHEKCKTAKTVKKHNLKKEISDYLNCIRHNEIKWLACIEYANKMTEVIKSLALKYGAV